MDALDGAGMLSQEGESPLRKKHVCCLRHLRDVAEIIHFVHWPDIRTIAVLQGHSEDGIYMYNNNNNNNNNVYMAMQNYLGNKRTNNAKVRCLN